MSFQEVDSNAIITNAELWFTEKYMYFPPAPATISEFEIWGAEIGSVKGKITTTMATTTATTEPSTTEPYIALLEAIPSFQIPGVYNSTSPAWRDFVTMFQEIGPEFRSGFINAAFSLAKNVNL